MGHLTHTQLRMRLYVALCSTPSVCNWCRGDKPMNMAKNIDGFLADLCTKYRLWGGIL